MKKIQLVLIFAALSCICFLSIEPRVPDIDSTMGIPSAYSLVNDRVNKAELNSEITPKSSGSTANTPVFPVIKYLGKYFDPKKMRNFVPVEDGPKIFVSEAGSDSNPGTESQPLRTIQKAIDRAIAGNTVFVRKGTYREIVFIRKSGKPDKPLTLRNYPGELPVIQGAITLIDREYVHVSGFEIIGSIGRGGVYVRFGGKNQIAYNYIHDTESNAGVSVTRSSYNILQGNKISYGHLGIKVSRDCKFNLIERNHTFKNDKSRGQSDGIVVFGRRTNLNIIKNNLVHDNSDDGIDTWNGKNQLIVGNISFRNGYLVDGSIGNDGNGFKLGGHEHGSFGGGNLLINNISFDNKQMGFTTNGGPHANVLYHNIAFRNFRGFEEWASSGMSSFINNISYGNRMGETDLVRGTIQLNNIFSGNPGFVDANKLDFRLRKRSPAIDAGRVLTIENIPDVFLKNVPPFFRKEIIYQLSHDFEGNNRPQGRAIDVGAFER